MCANMDDDTLGSSVIVDVYALIQAVPWTSYLALLTASAAATLVVLLVSRSSLFGALCQWLELHKVCASLVQLAPSRTQAQRDALRTVNLVFFGPVATNHFALGLAAHFFGRSFWIYSEASQIRML